MSDFEARIKDMMESSLIEYLEDGRWIKPVFSSITLPKEFLQECYSLIDMDVVKARFVKRVENELANKLVKQLASELTADARTILADDELRNNIRDSVIKAIKGEE